MRPQFYISKIEVQPLFVFSISPHIHPNPVGGYAKQSSIHGFDRHKAQPTIGDVRLAVDLATQRVLAGLGLGGQRVAGLAGGQQQGSRPTEK